MKSNKLLTDTLQILTACLIWGYGYVVIKDSLDILSLDNLMTLRYLLAAAVLTLIFRKKLTATRGRTLGFGAAMGLLLYVSQIAQTAALGYADTTAGQVAFITALYVVMVPFLHGIQQRSAPNRFSVLAAALAVAGLFLLVQGGIGLTFGCRIAMLGSLFFSLHILVIDAGTRGEDPVLLTVWQFFWAFVFSALFQVIRGTPLPPFSLIPHVWWPLVYLGIFSTMLGFLMQTAGQKKLSPELSSILLATEAVFGMSFSVALTGERLGAAKLAGCALMMAAVLTAELKGE